MERDQATSGPPDYGTEEELANSVTHGIGLLASITGLIMLVFRGIQWNSLWAITSFSVYGTSLILLFLSSTLYHIRFYSEVRSVFRAIDHSSIYILIAGTYTPFTLVSLRGNWGWSLFGSVWGLALGGILFKVLSRENFSRVETATYVLMGWLSIVVAHKLFATIGLHGILLLMLGGVVYTLGIIFYNWEELRYHHAIWHLFVLGGGVCHYMAVYFFVAPP